MQEPHSIDGTRNLSTEITPPCEPGKSIGRHNTRVRLPHSVIIRAPGLLPMLYAPRELERELGVPARTIREWLTKGLAHRRDERGHIWLDGREVAAWVKALNDLQTRPRLHRDEAYCMRCRRPVKWLNPVRVQRGKQTWWRAVCPDCGGAIYRGGAHG